MAPSTPPPPSNVVLAAFTIASTTSLVMSPRTSFRRESIILRFVDQADTARVLVERARILHRARLAVERKRFRFRVRLAPFDKCATHATCARHVKARGKFAHVVENEEAAGAERAVPKIELGQGRLIFMRAVED